MLGKSSNSKGNLESQVLGEIAALSELGRRGR